MTQTLVHRGPDDGGIWIDETSGIGLGHRRLAIVDLSPTGHQPMLSPTGRFVIVFNGEIYNHRDLRRDLDQGGAVEWRGHSDTETLVAAMDRWGVRGAINRSVGMFAISVWDREERSLYLARDRMGEKPLYYGWAGGAFLFGSELKALMAFPKCHPEVDRRSLDQLLRRGYVPTPNSIYRDIYKLTPGTVLRIELDAALKKPSNFDGTNQKMSHVDLSTYWAYPSKCEPCENSSSSESEVVDGLEKVLSAAVESQMIADVPIGTFLSGGIDSSTITAIQQRLSGNRKIETFTLGFGEPKFNEAGHARAVAKHLGTSHSELEVTAGHALSVIPSLPEMYDEPFADSSQIPTYLLSHLTRGTVKVALSGDGGDELFGGYSRYVEFAHTRARLKRISPTIRAGLSRILNRFDIEKLNEMSRALAVTRLLPQLGSRSARLAGLIDTSESMVRFYGARMSQWEKSPPVITDFPSDEEWPGETTIPGLGDARQMMVWDATGYLPDDILCKLDRAAMAAGLETRAPFLDHRVVKFAAGVPMAMKLRPDGGKGLLRDLLYRYVPRELVDRPKSGFSLPLDDWLRGPLRTWASDLLDPSRLRDEGWFDERRVTNRWEAHTSGRRSYSSALWPILMFQAWSSRSTPIEAPKAIGRPPI